MPSLSVITGAFGFTGRHIALQLLANGERVKTITGRPNGPNEFGDRISVAPFHFDEPEKLAAELSGAATLYNTYWIRFNRGEATFQRAAENTKTLIRAAKDAGVQRLVHISITNPSLGSPYPYFRGKAEVERAIRESGLCYAIISARACLRRGRRPAEQHCLDAPAGSPSSLRPDRGNIGCSPSTSRTWPSWRLRPQRSQRTWSWTRWGLRRIPSTSWSASWPTPSAAGPASCIYPQWRPLFLARLIGWAKSDVALTRDEVNGLLDNLLVSDGPATGTVSLRAWLTDDAVLPTLGAEYASELKRNYRR